MQKAACARSERGTGLGPGPSAPCEKDPPVLLLSLPKQKFRRHDPPYPHAEKRELLHCSPLDFGSILPQKFQLLSLSDRGLEDQQFSNQWAQIDPFDQLLQSPVVPATA